MANEVQVKVRESPTLTVIEIEGEVTSVASEALTGAYREAVGRGARSILLDFTGVDYLNSAGISIVIGILTDTREAGGRLLIAGLTPHYRKIFDMMGLSRYAPVFDSEDAARRAISVDR